MVKGDLIKAGEFDKIKDLTLEAVALAKKYTYIFLPYTIFVKISVPLFVVKERKNPQPLCFIRDCGFLKLFEFHCSCRLWCEIIKYTVDSRNFMCDTFCNMNH